MDNQSNRSEGDFVYGSESEQSTKDIKSKHTQFSED